MFHTFQCICEAKIDSEDPTIVTIAILTSLPSAKKGGLGVLYKLAVFKSNIKSRFGPSKKMRALCLHK